MNSKEIEALVFQQIGDAWRSTNLHHANLRESLVIPEKLIVFDRRFYNGKLFVQQIEVWLVLIENPKTRSGYRIVAKLDGSSFGLASTGWPTDEDLEIDSWYDNFLDTFFAM